MITSNSNTRIKNVIQLISSSKARKQQKKYVVEGVKMFEEAPAKYLSEIYVSESFASSKEGEKVLRGHEYEIVTDTVFKKMSDTVTPQGILSVLEMRDDEISDYIKAESVKILILEGLQDPGNLGTMIRTSEAAGFDFILADKNTVDVYNPKVIRSTMGSIYRIPVIYTDDLKRTLIELKEEGIKLFAAHLKGNKSYKEESYGNKCGILVGNEGKGLSDEISNVADSLVKIPMKGKVESLNAAVAASIMMFEAG